MDQKGAYNLHLCLNVLGVSLIPIIPLYAPYTTPPYSTSWFQLECVETEDPSLVEPEKGKYCIVLILDLELKSFSCSVEVNTNLR